ncbi:MAG: acyltransferase family protein [Acidobacteriaceae bacterium]
MFAKTVAEFPAKGPAIPPKHIPTLDGWRAVAILMLLYGHAFGFAIRLPFNPAFCGVNLFFVLSGFLITYRLLTDYTKDGNVQFSKFYIRRVFRILPPAFTYLLCIYVLGIAGILPRWDRGIIAAALFARNYVSTPDNVQIAGWFTGHFWSLAIEEHFYLLWPLALHLAGMRRAKWVAVAGIVICFVWRLSAWHYGLGSSLNIPFYFRTDTRFDALLVGSLFGLAYASERTRTTLSNLLTKRDTTVLLILYGIVLLRMFEPADLKELFLVGCMLAVTSLHPTSWLGKFLSLRPMRWIGQISYSLYIWQQLLLGEGHQIFGRLGTFPLNILATLTFATLSFYTVERFAIKAGYRLTAAKPKTACVTEAATASTGNSLS